jgi:hypothetical protein
VLSLLLQASSQNSTVLLQCSSEQQAQQLWQALQPRRQQKQQSAAGAAAGNIFDAKTEKGSAELYFHYYGMLMHQQNMLQVRPVQTWCDT